MVAKHIIFVGSVQGVGFRFTAHSIANSYALAGFVRNSPDGTVEMFIQGPPDDVDDCINQIEDSFAGYIRQTRAEDVPPDPKHTGFRITF